MRILMLCTKFPLDPKDRYMTNELAAALVAAGQSVRVVVTDWDAPYGAPPISTRCADGVEALVIAPRAVRRLGNFTELASKWTLSSLFALAQMRKALREDCFDALVCFTPCVTVAAQLLWASKQYRTRNMLYVHDFFPYHHRSIGLVPEGSIFGIARLVEEYLIRHFHVIGCNWPSNIAYLKENYRLQSGQQVIWTPLWGDVAAPPSCLKDAARARFDLPRDRKIVVFGGQITEGRGVEELIAVADIAKSVRPDLSFLFVGDGRLVPLVEKHIASGGTNVMLKGRIPREEYLTLLWGCDVGLVVTVKQVDSSSFPTKTIDYLRASIPIVAAVEEDSDYRAFLDEWKIGISLTAGNADALFGAIVQIVDDSEMHSKIESRARSCLDAVFDVKQAARRLIAAMGASI